VASSTTRTARTTIPSSRRLVIEAQRDSHRRVALALDVRRVAVHRQVERDARTHVDADARRRVPQLTRIDAGAAHRERVEAVLVAAVERLAAVALAGFRHRRPLVRAIADVAA